MDKVFSVLDDLCRGRATPFQRTRGMAGHSPPLTPKVRDYSTHKVGPLPFCRREGVFLHIALCKLQVAKLQSCKVAKFPSCKVVILQCCNVAKLPSFNFDMLPSWQVAKSQSCKIASKKVNSLGNAIFFMKKTFCFENPY